MDDLISRQSAIGSAISGMTMTIGGEKWIRVSEVRESLYSVPSAQRKGEWIYPTDIKGFGRCPHCKALWDYSLISNPFFKFCPRCGNEENELTELKGEEDVRKSD